MKLGPYELNTIITGDARKLAKAIPDESVDLLVEDPPYGIGYASSRKTRTNGAQRTSRASFGADVLDVSIVAEYGRILKSSGALYLFTRWDVLQVWKEAIENAGLIIKQRIIWDKMHWGMGDLKYYGSQTEDILFCIKSRNHKLNWSKRVGDLWSFPSRAYLPEGQYDHPTQKPEALIRRAVINSSNPNSVVVDMFCGSGTLPKVAKDVHRNYLAFEIDPAIADMARQRVAETQPPLPLVMPEQMEIGL